MQEPVTLRIDGAFIQAPRGRSVLDVAIEYGVCIPHLCHYPGLSDIGVCRLCIVENVVDGRAKVTASCTLEVAEGMVIHTNSDRVRKLRRNLAELLVAQAPNSRAIQDIAVRCGVTNVRFPFRHEDCVLCGRCVRACNEIWHTKAIGFVGRGDKRRIESPFGRRLDYCKHCSACVDLCPMTITPCPGPMKPGQERLCGQCESQLSMSKAAEDSCVWCGLGKGFQCTRQLQAT